MEKDFILQNFLKCAFEDLPQRFTKEDLDNFIERYLSEQGEPKDRGAV